MRFKTDIKKLFRHPEDAMAWAKAHGLDSKRSKAIDMFTFNPVYDVYILAEQGEVRICYEVKDITKKSDPSGTFTAQAVFFSVVIEFDKLKPESDKFAFK